MPATSARSNPVDPRRLTAPGDNRLPSLLAARPELVTRVLDVVARTVTSAVLEKRSRLTARANSYVGRIARFALDEVGDFATRQRAERQTYRYHLNVI